MSNNIPNKIKKTPSNQEKFMHYKFLLDKTYNKLNKLVKKNFTISNIDNRSDKFDRLKYLTSKIENLLLLTNEYKILIELENEKKLNIQF